MQEIKLRAHHLLCIPRFFSGGYDQIFAENMKKICLKIRKNPNIKIKVIAKCDDLCDKCPHQDKKRKTCVQSEYIGKWVLFEDKKLLKYLNIKNNSVHKARDVFSLSMKKVDSSAPKACKGCPFLDNCIKTGINNSFRKELNKCH